MPWLHFKDGVARVRRVVPVRLRPFFNGKTTITKSLRTGDAKVAQSRALKVAQEIDAAFRAAERRLRESDAAPLDLTFTGTDEAVDMYLTTALEGNTMAGTLDSTTRANYTALLNRDEPTISHVFTSYYDERNLPAKSKLEWERARKLLISAVAVAAVYSKRFGRLLRSIGITDKRKVFHSARGTVKDKLRAARVPVDVQNAILGHSGGPVGETYGLGYPMSVLHEAVSKIKYEAK